jgi:hypothetical protein
LGDEVQFVQVEALAEAFAYHYRLPATIALAETARQVGQRAPASGRRPAREEPSYDKALQTVAGTVGEEVLLEDLMGY